MSSEGRYIYCIIDDSNNKDFGIEGIAGAEAYSIGFKYIGAVISRSPVVNYCVSRENVMAHMKVMERIMTDHIVLPVKFGTVASGNTRRNSESRIRSEILKARYEELKELLDRLSNKVEVGLKAIWTDMGGIFREIVEENRDIKMLRDRISSGSYGQALRQKIMLGEMVKMALEAKRAEEEDKILKTFEGTYHDIRRNKIYGDNMITNTAFLVEKCRIGDCDRLVETLESAFGERIKLKYVGAVPPCNFVELVIPLKGEQDEREEA